MHSIVSSLGDRSFARLVQQTRKEAVIGILSFLTGCESRVLPVVLASISLMYCVSHLNADSTIGSPQGQDDEMIPNWAKIQIDTPTMGGRQLWGDILFFQGYRLQHNVVTGHYRLLDPGDIRRAWGTREDCLEALQRIRDEKSLPPMSGKAVILIHGIFRSSKSFHTLAKKLKDSDYTVVNFDYPSTRLSLIELSDYLDETIASLEGINRIDFVVHSMGGLLVRTYLMKKGPSADPRLFRMVMLGVPNQGARMANLLQKNWLFQVAFGPAGQQLVDDPAGFIAALPVPSFEFAVIAGIRGTPEGWNPLIPGDDDGTVSADSVKLPGASDSIQIRALHSSMMWNPEVIDATISFLNTGALRADGTRHPISFPDDSLRTDKLPESLE